MKIKESYSDFFNFIDIGIFGYIIKTDKFGVETPFTEAVEHAKFFDNILICGDIVSSECEELLRFIKHFRKYNTNATIFLESDGKTKPKGLNSLKDIVYNVYIDYKDTIKYDVLNWFSQTNSRFIFKVSNEDDLSVVDVILMDFPMRKSKIYICPLSNVSELKDNIKARGFNFTPMIEW